LKSTPSIPEDDIADMEFELSEIADKDGKGLDSWKGEVDKEFGDGSADFVIEQSDYKYLNQ